MLQTIYDIFRIILKSTGALLQWKKIKFNKVADSFQAARSLAMIILEELERYLIDVMITIELSDEERLEMVTKKERDDFPIIFAKMYTKFLKENEWCKGNLARRYCCNYVIMTRRFRMYWNAIRIGDKMVQESIFCSWIGIFSLLRKRNYVSIALNTIEQEYGKISYKDLEQLRMNSYIKFNGSNEDKDGRKFYCVALDECQEILNSWTKKLPMGTDEARWVEHSKNLMFARQCINFENREYRRGHIKSSYGEKDTLCYKSESSSDHIHTIKPRNTNEKILIYEFILGLLHTENASCQFTYDQCNKVIEKIHTTNNISDPTGEGNTTNPESSDSLEDCINELFDNVVSNDTIVDAEENDDDIDDIDVLDECPMASSNIGCHRLSMIPIFEEAIKELESKNIIETRHRRKKRMDRNYNFFLEINENVSNYVIQTRQSVDRLTFSDNGPYPSFCANYRQL